MEVDREEGLWRQPGGGEPLRDRDLRVQKGVACEQRLWEIEKEVLGMLRSIFWLEVGLGQVPRGVGVGGGGG